jgi:2,3-bisphosphoglycerate-independent phosphoglycerate mutase
MGNSEVGHLNIGAGRCVYQELTRIDRAIADGTFATNRVLLDVITHATESGKPVHLLGLLSDGGVHSHLRHIKALVQLAHKQGAPAIYVHALLDGRDVSPTSGATYLAELEAFLQDIPQVHIATVMGRYYGMDRDRRWERTECAYKALVERVGECVQPGDLCARLRASYAEGITDEFVRPLIVSGTPSLGDGDSLIVCNFRPDRVRQITRALTARRFDGFERTHFPRLQVTCLTEYDPAFALPVAFPKTVVAETLADVLARAGLRQLHVAETEKYAHVTFFFNGGVEEPKEREERILVPSPKVATYDMQPEMSAAEVTRQLVAAIKHEGAAVFIVNYANGDMVGHSGDFEATVRAVEAVDRQLAEVLDALRKRDGMALITADHGNAEQMHEQDGSPHTAHTANPVPLILVGTSVQMLRADGSLADIAPTLLALLGLDSPSCWTGRDLVVH